MQHLQHLAVLEAAPGQLTAVRAPVQTAGELQPFFGEGGDGRARRAGAGEGGEQAPDGALHLGVGVEGDVAGRVVDEPDGELEGELALACPGQDPPAQARPQEMQFCFLW